MTYKEIINRFRTVVEDHYMLQDFGYGQLSDLKTQSQLGPEEQGVDYPYLFLLPGTSNRQGPVMNYSFNMIVMDMARLEEGDLYDNYVTIQSQCQQYIDDVLGQLYYAYKDQPEIELTGIQYTPFKEKYQDELAGMTASITIQVPTPLNNCIAPFETLELASEVSVLTGTRDYNSGGAGSRKVFDSFAVPEAPQLYKVVMDVNFKTLYDISSDGSPWNIPVISFIQDAANPRFIKEIPFDGLTRDVQNVKTEFYVTLEDVAPDNNDFTISYGFSTLTPLPDVPLAYPIAQANAIEAISGTLKIYKVV